MLDSLSHRTVPCILFRCSPCRSFADSVQQKHQKPNHYLFQVPEPLLDEETVESLGNHRPATSHDIPVKHPKQLQTFTVSQQPIDDLSSYLHITSPSVPLPDGVQELGHLYPDSWPTILLSEREDGTQQHIPHHHQV